MANMADNQRTRNVKARGLAASTSELSEDQFKKLVKMFDRVWNEDAYAALAEYVYDEMKDEWWEAVEKALKEEGYPPNAAPNYVDFEFRLRDRLSPEDWANRAIGQQLIDVNDFHASVQDFFEQKRHIQLKAEGLGRDIEYTVIFNHTPKEWKAMHVAPEAMLDALKDRWDTRAAGEGVKEPFANGVAENPVLSEKVHEALAENDFPSITTHVNFDGYLVDATFATDLVTIIAQAYGGKDGADGSEKDGTVSLKELRSTQFPGVMPGFDLEFRRRLYDGDYDADREFAAMVAYSGQITGGPSNFDYTVQITEDFDDWASKNPVDYSKNETFRMVGDEIENLWTPVVYGGWIIDEVGDKELNQFNELFDQRLREEGFPEQATIDNVEYNAHAHSLVDGQLWADVIYNYYDDQLDDLSGDELFEEMRAIVLKQDQFMQILAKNADGYIEITPVFLQTAQEWETENLSEAEQYEE